jgi:predicted peptidase
MKTALQLLLLYLLIFAGCSNHDEEVLPATPVTDTVSTDTTGNGTPQNFIPRDPDTVLLTPDSAYYQYGKFEELPYRILLPSHYDSTKHYPFLLFLHGIGESGTDNEKQLRWGAPLFLEDSIRKKYPAIVVFPQCPTTNLWEDDIMPMKLTGLLNSLLSTYTVDSNRIYIGGLSMGAYGTYKLVPQMPELFAAAIAISGDGDPGNAPHMRKTAWRIFAGKKDEIVPSSKSEKMAKALQQAGAEVLVKIYPNADHRGSWVNAFAEPDFCSWLFSKSKGKNH